MLPVAQQQVRRGGGDAPVRVRQGGRGRGSTKRTLANQGSLWVGKAAGGDNAGTAVGGVCGVVRLSPPTLRSGLRWLRASGDDPAG